MDYSAEIEQLTRLQAELGQDDPLELFTLKSIQSYLKAAQMVMAMGTPAFQDGSLRVYGGPGDLMPGCDLTNVQLAQRLVDMAACFDHPYLDEPELCVPARHVAEVLESRSRPILRDDTPEVQIVTGLSAKATATMTTVRLRDATCFNRYDADQLYVHEVMTHSLTALNGQRQPVLSLMGQGAPRTTWTQEGLATFAEVITGSIDLNRLVRLALRILAIERALQGANFLETFDFFRRHGQSEKESFWSSARIFRGGFPEGGIVFTKDSVYLDGLIKVYHLFRWAMMHERIGLLHLLFCGRVALNDLYLLEEALEQKQILLPKYVPEWYERIQGLAGILGFSLLSGLVDIDQLDDYYEQRLRKKGPRGGRRR